MSNPEIQGNLEIGTFKSPEELARALEEKSKTEIAGKIRKIAGEVQGNSVDLRKKLQEELTPQEQTEIRSALPDSGVDRVLDKKLSSDDLQAQAGKTVIAGVLGNETADMLEKGEGYFKSLTDSWETAGKLFEEGKWLAAIGVFLKGLFGQFSLKDWNAQTQEKEEGKKEDEKKGEKLNTTSLPMKMIIEYSYKGSKENKQKIINISQTDNFKNLTLKEINTLSSDENELKKWIEKTYPNGGIDFKHVQELFQLFSHEGNAYKTLKSINKNGFDENKKVIDLLTPSNENKNMYIYEKFSNLDASSLRNTTWEFIKIDTESISKGEFISNGVNGNILTFILSNSFKLGDNIETLLTNKESSLNEIENSKIREIINFGNKINDLIRTNPTINLGSEINLTGTLSLTDMTKMYILLGGETDFNKMNEFQQGFLYFTIPGLLGEKGSRGNFHEGGYTAKLGLKIKDATLNKANDLPEGVNRFFSNIGNKIIDSSMEFLKDIGLNITGGASEIIKTYPWLVPILISVVLIYPFAQRKSILSLILRERKINK